MIVDTPQNVKSIMKGEVIEIICDPIRAAVQTLKEHGYIDNVQAFGDRLNIVVERSARDYPVIERILRDANISITEWRTINPSLENVFIELMLNQPVEL